MRLSHKIYLYFGTFIFIVILMLVIINYLVLERALHQNAKKEVKKIVESVNTAASKVLDSSIRNYMRGVLEQDFIVLEELYQQSQTGTLTEKQAKDAFQEHVLGQVIGTSGYIVALRPEDSKIWIDIHPHVRGTDCAFNQGCQEWVAQRNGYNSYEWKNPNDETKRQKVGYFKYFEPWNWIVGTTSYRDELIELVKIDDLKEIIEPFKILDKGYFYVIDRNYTMLIHPELEGKNVYHSQNEKGVYIAREVRKNIDDFYYYSWRNPSENKELEKFTYTKILKDLDWYICASGYLDDITAPIKKLLYIRLAFIALVAVILLVITMIVSRSLTRPLNSLIHGLNSFHRDKKVFKMGFKSVQELDSVGHAIETMTKNLLVAENEKQSILDQLDSIINSMPSMLIGVDIEGRVTLWNNKAAEYFGLSQAGALGKSVSEVMAEFKDELAPIKKSIDSQTYYSSLCSITTPESITKHFEVTFFPLQFSMKSAVIRLDDISDRVMMEESLTQAQKMESLGTLAGGIAHDFNNILSAIYGYAELVQRKLEPGTSSYEMQSQLLKAADRARGLVEQILLFSRQTEHRKQLVEPHLIFKEALKLLRSSIPKTIEIQHNISKSCGSILADPTQIHQIIMNLCTNSYHAMRHEGGTLSVTLSEVGLSEGEITSRTLEIEPGNYLKLVVSDTGHGMEQETLAKVFDPFFTTKATGEGTGLGLSVVHGIVTSSKGHITVNSEVGSGTTVEILLPLADSQENLVAMQEEDSLPKGSEHILLVDDEESILDTTRMMLVNLGYQVTNISSGVQALDLFQATPGTFDLIITDMTMPQMTGLELTRNIFSIRPEVPVIMCTGFSELINKEQAYSIGIKGFLTKPVLSGILARTVRDALDN